jgi:hypothetical protein
MSTELEDRLAESMRAYAADVSTAGVASLAGRARARHRRRQIAVGGALTACAAGGTAAVLVVALASAQPTASTLRAQTAAYVTSQTEHALAGRAHTDFVYVRTTVGGPGVPYYWGTSPRTRVAGAGNWSYGRQDRTEVYAADGKAIADVGTQTKPKATTITTVLYRSATWSRWTEPSTTFVQLSPAHCRPFSLLAVPFLYSTSQPPNWAGLIRHALTCGQLIEAGRQVIDGQHVIRLEQKAASVPGAAWRSVYWVSSSTYLPVRIRMEPTSGRYWWEQQDFSWSQPTAANLAQLRVRIPAGFRRVRGSASPVAILILAAANAW